MSQAELMLIDTHGSRPEALRELRRLTGRSLAELNALLSQLPCAIERGEPEALLTLATSASSILELQIWEDGEPLREHVPRRAGPHVEQRVAVAVGSAGVRFRVDDVDVATSLLPTRPELEAWAELCDGAPAYHPARRDFVTSSATLHPLVGAIQLAFDQHRPLRLTPDAMWLTIAAGFAQHVNTHAQALRERFVRHDGRKTLTVTWHGSLTSLATDLAEAVARDMGEGIRRLFQCSFSTSTELDRIASDLVFLGAFRRYYDLVAVAICGIPEIELRGSADDWRTIRQRLDVLAEFGAESWMSALRPLADEWVRTASGEPDIAFWKAIYKPRSRYVADATTGWITQLFPFLEDGAPNRSLGTGGPDNGYCYAPLSIGDLPTGVVRAPVRTDAEMSLDVLAGLAGITQDSTGVLEPVSGWAAIDRPFSRLVERLLDEHPMLPPEESHGQLPLGVPGALLEILDCCAGGPLHGGRWKLRAQTELESILWPQDPKQEGIQLQHAALVFADLADGRRVAAMAVFVHNARDVDWWIILVPQAGLPSDTDPVIAKGMQSFLEAVLDEGDTFFFEAPGFEPDGVIADAST